ncbi:MAG: hypothetical protein HRT90_03280 [Candidatus Margulisbacteria bacterium]|nr:hypothetical protein [Candidatus Margulisiibacteriota bacterium]
MSTIEFYNVKKRKKVKINDSQVKKTTYEKKIQAGGTSVRYAFRAQDDDGTNLTKFCSEGDWKGLNAPTE